MKTLAIALALFSIGFRCPGQVFGNAFTFETLASQRVITDDNGFVYSLGYDQKQNSPWSGGTGTMHLKIQKLDPATGNMVWERSATAPDFLYLGGASLYDGTLFLGGSFRDKICSGTLCAVSKGKEDLFLLSVSESGDLDLRTEGGTGGEFVQGFTTDAAGNLYFSGGASGMVTLGTRTYSSKAEKDPFIYKKDNKFQEISCAFGIPVSTPGYSDTPGVAYGLAIHNRDLYAWFTGWSVMEGSADTVGRGTYAQLHRVGADIGSYTRVKPIYSTVGNHRELNFVDPFENYYYTAASYFKTTKQSVVKADKLLNTTWSYSVTPGTIGNLLSFGRYYYFAQSGRHPETSENILYIMQGTGDAATAHPACGIHLYFSGNYIYDQSLHYYGQDMLLTGRFTGNLYIDNRQLTSTAEKGSFATIIRLRALTALPETAVKHASVFPNPAAGVVHITTENEEKYFSLTDLSGRMVLSGKGTSSNELALDVSGLQPGIYFLQLSHKGSTETHKLIIER